MRDLSFWQPTKAGNWRIAGAAEADFRKNHHMTATKGEGVLVNLPDDKNRSNLVSVPEYGDVEVAFDFMMAQHSNSGFYLQGRYEVQLLDSWGRLQPAFNDCGGIFARRRFQPVEELLKDMPLCKMLPSHRAFGKKWKSPSAHRVLMPLAKRPKMPALPFA